ncbi:MAG TPA: S53 family peptidase [Oculatellaceae cyanobacterium]
MKRVDQFIELEGSSKGALSEEILGPTNLSEQLLVTLQLRKRPNAFRLSPYKHGFYSRLQVRSMYSAEPQDLPIVRTFAAVYNLEIVRAELHKRTLVLHGTVAQMREAFKVILYDQKIGNRIYRTRSGPIQIPRVLEGIVTGVFGLDNRPQASHHLRYRQGRASARSAGKPDAYDGNSLASIYNFPLSDGSGQTIGIIELGGGFNPSDISDYFQTLGLPAPVVKAVSVDGGTNAPGVDTGADTEVALDIEVAGAVAPGATIVVYFAPNTSQGFLNAILTAVHDKTNQPGILSISWGGPESNWTSQQMTAMDDAFKAASELGMSVFVAAGDDGADDNVGDGCAHVDFPASSPSVTACGGTTLSYESGVKTETVWNDMFGGATGGGISNFFARPSYQQSLAIPSNLNGSTQGRGLPDVSAVADPNTGYSVLVDGNWQIVGGTSAVAPLFAGMTARFNQLASRHSGLFNTVIYGLSGSTAFNDIVTGDNSCDGVNGYSAGPGWDPVSGFGSPKGAELFALFVRDQNETAPHSNVS